MTENEKEEMSSSEKEEEEETKLEEEKLEKKEAKEGQKESGEKEKKPGVVYMSRIPTKMNVKLIREYMSRFGKVGRVYLEPKEKRRKNEPRSFKEGWVEFEKRKVAREVAKQLNNATVGGKRRNPWYFELWNLKYLKGFRWVHLNERIAYEQELKKQKLRQDIALAKKEANFYIQNFEKNERRKRMEKKEDHDEERGKEEGTEQSDKRMKRQLKEGDDDDETETKTTNKHPIFERKVKVTGNDEFLRQIFS